MSVRTRKYAVLAIIVVIGAFYGHVAGGLSDLEYYAGAAGLLLLVCAVALPWLEYAPDGAFRRDPQA